MSTSKSALKIIALATTLLLIAVTLLNLLNSPAKPTAVDRQLEEPMPSVFGSTLELPAPVPVAGVQGARTSVRGAVAVVRLAPCNTNPGFEELVSAELLQWDGDSAEPVMIASMGIPLGGSTEVAIVQPPTTARIALQVLRTPRHEGTTTNLLRTPSGESDLWQADVSLQYGPVLQGKIMRPDGSPIDGLPVTLTAYPEINARAHLGALDFGPVLHPDGIPPAVLLGLSVQLEEDATYTLIYSSALKPTKTGSWSDLGVVVAEAGSLAIRDERSIENRAPLVIQLQGWNLQISTAALPIESRLDIPLLQRFIPTQQWDHPTGIGGALVFQDLPAGVPLRVATLNNSDAETTTLYWDSAGSDGVLRRAAPATILEAITASEQVPPTYVVTEGARLFGQVLQPDGTPAPQAIVELSILGKSEKEVTCDAGGHFSFTLDVPLATHSQAYLSAFWDWNPDKRAIPAMKARPFPNYNYIKQQLVEAPANPDGHIGPIDIRLESSLSISGTVIGPSGSPTTGVMVVAIPTLEMTQQRSGQWTQVYGTSKAGGVFEVWPLWPGQYTLVTLDLFRPGLYAVVPDVAAGSTAVTINVSHVDRIATTVRIANAPERCDTAFLYFVPAQSLPAIPSLEAGGDIVWRRLGLPEKGGISPYFCLNNGLPFSSVRAKRIDATYLGCEFKPLPGRYWVAMHLRDASGEDVEHMHGLIDITPDAGSSQTVTLDLSTGDPR
jgi:hypothetical protein